MPVSTYGKGQLKPGPAKSIYYWSSQAHPGYNTTSQKPDHCATAHADLSCSCSVLGAFLDVAGVLSGELPHHCRIHRRIS